MTKRLTLADFEACLNQPFTIRYGNDETLTVTLIEVKKWGADTASSGAYQPFAVIFQSNITAYLPQATYSISNELLGEHDIFIVPHAPNTIGIQYEATFS